ncbi:DNA-directed RNA polymerase [Lithospermum erythrorhizon]|uniref:DNA-directed RNA polymerase n=1 Tax=Lithospermum erythrorhizon TaxID=34254 RepID=A0AAV3PU48_LITER
MTLSDKEVWRLFLVRKTVLQMMKDRGYAVTDYELEMTVAQFIDKYGENMKREDIDIQISNSADQICIFFPEEPTVGLKTLMTYVNRMRSENVNRAILVVQLYLNRFARAYLNRISSEFNLEVFQEAELLVNIKEQVLVPVHEVLRPKENKTIHSEGNSVVNYAPRSSSKQGLCKVSQFQSDPIPPTIEDGADMQDLMAPKPPTIVIPTIVTGEDVCMAYFGRKKALKTAVLDEFKQLYRECNTKEGKLSLLAYEDGRWEVVQFGSTNSIPYPINICDPSLMSQKLWRQRVATQCDTWLHEQAMNSCTHQAQRKEVFDIISCSTPIVSLIPKKSISETKMKRTNVILENMEDEDEDEVEVIEKEMEISADTS